MLIDDYYKIIDRHDETGIVVFDVELNKNCKVYEGHFPGEPVSPGVCNIQMVKECAEEVCGCELLLRYVQQCRLTTLITPIKYPKVQVKVQLTEGEDCWKLRGTIGIQDEVFLDLKGECVKMKD